MRKIIECIPNFSEGTKPEVIYQIVKSIAQFSNVYILDINRDKDHNRSVVTFIGEPNSVIEAAFQATKTAAKLINLSTHKGVHPRIGATDIIPLVPIKNITYKECVKLANKLGKRIGEELKIPIYLYEKAATTTERKNLANIRSKKISGKPNFGPKKLGKSGATVVGVRNFLIAFNVNLKSNDLAAAKAIATKIRQLPSVKALGLELKSKKSVQVSMNLTNYKKTTPLQAFKAVKKEAKTLGIEILESELIGIAPKDSMPKDPKTSLLLKAFHCNQIVDFSRILINNTPRS
ncbi:MAG: glutamate formimidoyltransferase [Nitrospirae bacterium]|nr:glutamate formimidoyltransferase [Nitrospirota bacterium]